MVQTLSSYLNYFSQKSLLKMNKNDKPFKNIMMKRYKIKNLKIMSKNLIIMYIAKHQGGHVDYQTTRNDVVKEQLRQHEMAKDSVFLNTFFLKSFLSSDPFSWNKEQVTIYIYIYKIKCKSFIFVIIYD